MHGLERAAGAHQGLDVLRRCVPASTAAGERSDNLSSGIVQGSGFRLLLRLDGRPEFDEARQVVLERLMHGA
jgi:hypothetical protein